MVTAWMRHDSPVGRLIVEEFVTVDGVMEAPGWDEHRAGRNAWALRRQDDELQRYQHELFASIDAILLGRTTYQIWAAFWPSVPVPDAFSRRINALPKYVASTTLKRLDWENSHLLGADTVAAVQRLKDQTAGPILVEGSADLFDTLMANDLVDEYRLMFFPVILGAGKRLFREDIDQRPLRLTSSRAFPAGVVLLVYEPESEEPTTRFVEEYVWTQEQQRSWQAAQNVDRILATVLFTDIVDSTAKAAALGDRAWRQLLDRHDEVARREVDRWHGSFVKSTGDGILATFDAPTRALHCAFGLRDAIVGLDLQLRASIHTGEVELRQGDVGGIGVHIASRALTQAAPGGVVVTRTVRDLVTGTDLAFSPLGSVGLRGIPGTWELYQASIG
jgi:class 3 adenylate cyclase